MKYMCDKLIYYRYIILMVFMSILFFIKNTADAETFKYKTGLTIEAPDYKTAAKLCFKKLNPVYITEEAGMEVISICANPIVGEVK